MIDEEAKQGLKYFSASEAIDEEIKSLVEENKVLDTELDSFRSLYTELKTKI
ncbi:hypothetical protein A2U01_0007151 [Trifolium medium]|uniref:Uncharacterized protein n=1 Tax=Trifolium medium TaxID=97028 RepID=A0A392MFL3_9FABA|nr:hypothetical protein [Trifolium medium]